jgi:hypothetical protein
VLAAYNEPNDTDPRGNYGVEYAWDRTVFVRGGYYQNYDAAKLSFGFGARFTVSGLDFRIDYALVDYQQLDSVNMFALGIEF